MRVAAVFEDHTGTILAFIDDGRVLTCRPSASCGREIGVKHLSPWVEAGPLPGTPAESAARSRREVVDIFKYEV